MIPGTKALAGAASSDCPAAFFLPKYIMSGINEILPNANLIPLKVNAPTYCMPTLWATNARPHMAAVSRSSILDFIS
jgi:hypothetical protein